jgi:hypothetical protein
VRTQNAVERQAWLARVVERGGLDPGAAREELRRALGGRHVGPAASPVAEAAARRAMAPPRAPSLLPAERWLLALVAQGAAGIELALDELHDEDVDGLASAGILRAAQAAARKSAPVSLAAVVDALGDDERRLMSSIAVEGVPAEHLSAEECVRELRRQPLLSRMAEIQKRLPGASGDALEALLQEKTRLVRQMASL